MHFLSCRSNSRHRVLVNNRFYIIKLKIVFSNVLGCEFMNLCISEYLMITPVLCNYGISM